MRAVILEARINEYASRTRNPNVPYTAEEIVADAKACVEAGASIIHFHARRDDGAPAHDLAAFRDVIVRLRDSVDALVHPTLGAYAAGVDARQRLENVERLVEEGLAPDLVPLDMGTSNVDFIDPATGRFATEEAVYINTTSTLRYFAERLRALGVTPYPQLWNVPTVRQLTAFLEMGYLDSPSFVALATTEGGMIATHPGNRAGLEAYLNFFPRDRIAGWSATLFGGNFLSLIPDVVDLGGHVSIGIGDYPYPELGYPTNARLIAEAADRIRAQGARVASAPEARALFGRSEPVRASTPVSEASLAQ